MIPITHYYRARWRHLDLSSDRLHMIVLIVTMHGLTQSRQQQQVKKNSRQAALFLFFLIYMSRPNSSLKSTSYFDVEYVICTYVLKRYIYMYVCSFNERQRMKHFLKISRTTFRCRWVLLVSQEHSRPLD